MDDVSVNIVNEQKLLSYLMRNLSLVPQYNKLHFQHKISKAVFHGLSKLNENNDEFNGDTLLLYAKEIYEDLEYVTVKEIHDSFTDFKNIESHKKVLENDYVKNIVAKQLLEDILTGTTQKDHLPISKIIDSAENIIRKLNSINVETKLATAQDMASRHKLRIDQRDKGLVRRSLGFRRIDEKLLRPGAPGQNTTIFSRSSYGKSVYVKNMESNLIKKGVCVVSISTEMLEESDVDRLLCIRDGYKLEDLNKKNMDPRMKAKINKSLEKFAEIKNYIYYNEIEETLNFTKIDSMLYKAKDVFRKRGVLPDDEYLLLVIDLLSDLEDFGDESREKITMGMKTLRRLIKKHNIHSVSVVQANQNKFRSGKTPKSPEECDKMYLGVEEIFGGSSYEKGSRVILSLNRPLIMKQQYFPEQNEEWLLEKDYMMVHCLKQNEGFLFMEKMVCTDNFRIVSEIES